MTGNLVANLLTVVISYLVGVRLLDRRNAANVIAHMRSEAAWRADLVIFNGSARPIYDLAARVQVSPLESHSLELRLVGGDSAQVSELLPGQSAKAVDLDVGQVETGVTVEFTTLRGRRHWRKVDLNR